MPDIHIRRFTLALAMLSACGRPPAVSDPVQREFWNGLRNLCGQAFAGRLVEAGPADRAALPDPLVLEIWQCYPQELRLAFHAANDHSRVWVLAPSANGLRLSHAIHSSDGAELEYSGYGGETPSSGTLTRQVFTPDEETLATVPSARGSEWVLEIAPGRMVSYILVSPAGAAFRLDFDLTQRAPRQSAPWGYTRVPARPQAGSDTDERN